MIDETKPQFPQYVRRGESRMPIIGEGCRGEHAPLE